VGFTWEFSLGVSGVCFFRCWEDEYTSFLLVVHANVWSLWKTHNDFVFFGKGFWGWAFGGYDYFLFMNVILWKIPWTLLLVLWVGGRANYLLLRRECFGCFAEMNLIFVFGRFRWCPCRLWSSTVVWGVFGFLLTF